ncbi:MAG TPA: hypothetical protein DCL35_02055 [Candidatus Omnitrophica bacterium]|nr:hypothetical protein [Candidatus Omnitrophota bacterium]
MDTPLVSFIIVVNNDAPPGAVFELLDSFYPQEAAVPFEMLVVEKTDALRRQAYSNRYPWVKLIECADLSRGSKPRCDALKDAQGELVVFLEDHVTIGKDYLKNIVELFEEGHDAVAGPVLIGHGDSASAWVEYFCEYHRWLPCRPDGRIDDLPGCNFAYRRSVLDALGDFICGDFKLENLFNQRAAKRGYKLYFSHRVPVRHYDDKSFPELLRYRFYYGKTFAAKRGFSFLKRVLYASLFPVIALVEYGRIARDAACDRLLLKKFIIYTPGLLLILMAWMFGESLGYITKREAHVFIRSR